MLIDESEEITSTKDYEDGLPNSSHTTAAVTDCEHDVNLCFETGEACPFEGSVDGGLSMGVAGREGSERDID